MYVHAIAFVRVEVTVEDNKAIMIFARLVSSSISEKCKKNTLKFTEYTFRDRSISEKRRSRIFNF